MTNPRIAYNLPIDLIDVQILSEVIYITSFYMYLFPAYIKNLQNVQMTL